MKLGYYAVLSNPSELIGFSTTALLTSANKWLVLNPFAGTRNYCTQTLRAGIFVDINSACGKPLYYQYE